MIELLPRPEWQIKALCRGTDPDLFFAEQRDMNTADGARDLCSHCPVRIDCLEFALERNERSGIWGGKSEKDRRPLRRLYKRGIRGAALLGEEATA